MTIKIGEKSYSTRKPKDLDASLKDVTGCDAVETARILMGYPNAGQIAAALHPFLPDDAPSIPDLASEIGPVINDVALDVRKLYADESRSKAQAPTAPASGIAEKSA